MTRIPLLTAALFSIFCSAATNERPPGSKHSKPNIVLILADDLGISDLGAYAERWTGTSPEKQFYETPAIDALIHNGTAFSQAYACPLCSPTRSSILTGKYAARIGFQTATGGRAQSWYNQNKTPPKGYLSQDAVFWLDNIPTEQAVWNGTTLLALPTESNGPAERDVTTIAELLNANGYRSAFVGKWHVGGHGSQGSTPKDNGFEEIAWCDAGGSLYFNWEKSWNRKKLIYPTMPQEELFIGKSEPVEPSVYLTDYLTDESVELMEAHFARESPEPLFLYLCHFAMHAPLQAKQEDIHYFEEKDTLGWNGHRHSSYAAMLRSLDQSIAKIVSTLKKAGQLDNTWIIFMSDNGGVTWPLNQRTKDPTSIATSNAPFLGGKAMVFEGGIRVPLFIYHASKSKHGWIDRPVDCNDILPTIADLAGVSLKNSDLDGQSLGEFLSDETESFPYSRERFFWHYPFNVKVHHPLDHLPLTPHSAIRAGDYKLIYDWSGRLWLFDLENDPSEKNNLVEVEPELTQQLFRELNEWLSENVADRYLPTLNPDYDPEKDTRDYPFVDLRNEYLGSSFAIQPRPNYFNTIEYP
ncbi:MAG: sulfatase [Opitutales bacterium]|nr:sulfatase [Opitutales bacterium]